MSNINDLIFSKSISLKDECGVCDGDGIDEGACDCDGNVLDECGICGGNNDCLPWTELTAVGGDNEITLAWFPLGDNRGRDFSLSLENVDTEAGTLDINLSNSEPVAGFQFNLEGINITGASGGSAGANGFMISTNSTTVLGFSFTGATISPQQGVLVTLDATWGEGNGYFDLENVIKCLSKYCNSKTKANFDIIVFSFVKFWLFFKRF